MVFIPKILKSIGGIGLSPSVVSVCSFEVKESDGLVEVAFN